MGGVRFNSDDPIEDCKQEAINNGWKYFAVEYGTECLTTQDAGYTYKTKGESNGCNDDGRGGWNAMNVYKIDC